MSWPGKQDWKQLRDPFKKSSSVVFPPAGQAHAHPHQSTHAYPAGSRVPRAPEKGSWCIPSSDTPKTSCFLLSWRLGGKGICFHPNLCEVLTLSPHFYLDFFHTNTFWSILKKWCFLSKQGTSANLMLTCSWIHGLLTGISLPTWVLGSTLDTCFLASCQRQSQQL